MSDVLHMPPVRHPRRFLALMFGCCAAPLLWVCQLLADYWVSAQACSHAAHLNPVSTGGLRSALLGVGLVAILGALAGLWVSLMLWRSYAPNTSGGVPGREHFMAVWGIFASLCFVGAIVFNFISSLTAPLCAS
jgi:hypothetical protein